MPAPRLSLFPDKVEYNTGRSYKMPGTGVGTGKPAITVPSITTILKLADKSALIQWAANETFKWCNEHWDLLGTRSDEDARRASVYQWKKVRDARAEVGTGVHEAVEAIHTGSGEFPLLDEEQESMLQQFEDFRFVHDVRPDYSELTVWNDNKDGLSYAGTLDGLWYIDGDLWLIDVKTGKNVYPEAFQQLAALHAAPTAWIHEGLDADLAPGEKKGLKKYVGTDEGVSYWRPIENPARGAQRFGALHLRQDSWDLVEAPAATMKHHEDVFFAYTNLWYQKEHLKRAEKNATLPTKEEL